MADGEAQTSASSGRKRGGWITFPFITGALAGLTLCSGGWIGNLIVYLIQEFNVKSVDAAQISNMIYGCTSFFPVIGAIIADSFLGSFSVISNFSSISLLGMVLLVLTATVDCLKPQPCEIGSTSSCTSSPSKFQFLVLYGGIILAAIGLGGTRFTMATMGANQFEKATDRGIFFNWFFFSLYVSAVVSLTVIVYIEDNVSWGLGFGISLAANFIGLAIFLLGNWFYHHDKPQGSPFMDMARVVVAAIRKRKVVFSSETKDYYQEGSETMTVEATTPTDTFRFLNTASVKVEGDIKPDGSNAKPWRLCSVQQVENLKILIRIFPLWSSSIFLATPIAIQTSFVVLQILTMDRHIGPHFKIPAGSILVLVLFSTSVSITLVDRLLCPMWQKLTHRSLTPLQRIGVGHVLNVLSMAVSAFVESERLRVAHSHNVQALSGSNKVPMLAAWWLFPQLVLVGIGEAFHFPGQVALYYQEFPLPLKNTATSMISLIIGIAFYLGAALIDLVRGVSSWLPDDINNGRLDNLYWALVVVGVFNFGYYLVCSSLYKYQNVENMVEVDNTSDK
ncbi:protein NRT1/ PTR FAMILY 2.7 isoform X2 [Carica papaya]|uniref:protein NRT1/ PTR FAMILY 2.7 isoform X2 n=1 Tax=Carica papaya TaxID=3649 RepID=UPI000B8CEAEB|nr:protein NRT1/ PTR FAMILY 2.7 isoform X2 [Carica papaya]